MQAAALQLSGLVKRFGETTAVDLTVPRGSFFGLVGANGAGKTTSLSMAVGLDRATVAARASELLEVLELQAVARPVRGSRRRSPWPSPFRRRR
jgi:ABC-type branched-subunit amino acid transport system ATPase component